MLQPPIAGMGHCILIKQHDQIDIAGIIQLPRAQLAHAENNQPAICFRIFRVGQGKFSGFVQPPQKVAAACLQGGTGEVGQRTCHLFQRPHICDIGGTDSERCPTLGDAQPVLYLVRRLACQRGPVGGGNKRIVKRRIRTGFEQPTCKRQIGNQTLAQIRAIAENRREQTGPVQVTPHRRPPRLGEHRLSIRGKIGIFTARHRFPPALAMNILLFRISGRRQNIRTGAPYFREKCQIDRSKSV